MWSIIKQYAYMHVFKFLMTWNIIITLYCLLNRTAQTWTREFLRFSKLYHDTVCWTSASPTLPMNKPMKPFKLYVKKNAKTVSYFNILYLVFCKIYNIIIYLKTVMMINAWAIPDWWLAIPWHCTRLSTDVKRMFYIDFGLDYAFFRYFTHKINIKWSKCYN